MMPPKAVQNRMNSQDKPPVSTQLQNKSKKRQKSSSSSDGQPEKERVYNQWTTEESSTVVEWFEVPENYDKWKFSGKANKATGRLNTTAMTRAALEREIQQYLASKGILRNISSVEGKIKSLENSWKKAHQELISQTGSRTDDLDEKLKAKNIKDLILKRCPFWDRLNPIYYQRPSMVAPHASDNLTEIDLETDSVLGYQSQEDIPELTEAEMTALFEEEDTSTYPVYGESTDAEKDRANTPANRSSVFTTKTNGKLTPVTPTLSVVPAHKRRRDEKRVLSTADALREVSRDRLAIERERLEMERLKASEEVAQRRTEFEDREKQRRFELEKIDKEMELIRLKLQLAQAQQTH